MSFGDILGRLLRTGVGDRRTRLRPGAQSLGAGGAAIGGILAQLQDAIGPAGGDANAAFGGMAERARQFLGQEQVGGMTGAQIGGAGAVAGVLLGGGVGGAARGGALAVLGTLALGAVRNAQARTAPAAGRGAAIALEPREIAAVTGPGSEKLLLRAMISAAKADGEIDGAEMEKIVAKVASGVTEDEKAFVMAEMRAPLDLEALAAEVSGEAQAAEVYAASLLAIDVDSEAERRYLRDLAAALNLDAATVAQLHHMTGAEIV